MEMNDKYTISYSNSQRCLITHVWGTVTVLSAFNFFIAVVVSLIWKNTLELLLMRF